MSWVWLNGSIVPTEDATVSVLDRGLLFDVARHQSRLQRSLTALKLAGSHTAAEFIEMCRDLITRNSLTEGYVYFQVTRGAGESRQFSRPPGTSQTEFAFVVHSPSSTQDWYERGVAVATHEELRWKRRFIKTIALLPQSIAADAAERAGAFEALLVADGWVHEGASSSFHVVKDGAVVMRPLDGEVLPGVTRSTVHEVAESIGLRVELRPFRLEEAMAADEAFLTAANLYVCPVVSIDGAPIGPGTVGPTVARLHAAYMEHIRRGLV